jgi:ArsR family transcriptional regulator
MKDFEMPTEEKVELASDGFRLLADPTRIKILWALLQGESSVACLADLVGPRPTAVSQHLSKLRLARLVYRRRSGTFAYYSAADEHVARLWPRPSTTPTIGSKGCPTIHMRRLGSDRRRVLD